VDKLAESGFWPFLLVVSFKKYVDGLLMWWWKKKNNLGVSGVVVDLFTFC